MANRMDEPVDEREPARRLSEGPAHEARSGRASALPRSAAARLDCAAKKWRSGRISARPGTRGSSKGGAGRPRRTCSIGSRAPSCSPRSSASIFSSSASADRPKRAIAETTAPRRGCSGCLDALDPSPALIRNARYDVVAWNRAATVMLVDYGSLPPEQRNILRFIFLDPRARAAQYDWASVARFVLGAFRVDAARAGAAAEVEPLVDERQSPQSRVQGDVARQRCSRSTMARR